MVDWALHLESWGWVDGVWVLNNDLAPFLIFHARHGVPLKCPPQLAWLLRESCNKKVKPNSRSMESLNLKTLQGAETALPTEPLTPPREPHNASLLQRETPRQTDVPSPSEKSRVSEDLWTLTSVHGLQKPVDFSQSRWLAGFHPRPSNMAIMSRHSYLVRV